MSFDRYIASVSFGKDSLAMVLLILERGLPLDEVVFYDTGMEFKAIYDTRDRVLPIMYDHGVKYTELRPPRPFLFDMLEKPVSSKKNGLHYGYSWCGGCARWGTANKTSALDKHAKAAGKNVIQYIGIAADEQKRLQSLEIDTSGEYPRFYYPPDMVDQAIADIMKGVTEKRGRYHDYGKALETARARTKGERGFWEQARLVKGSEDHDVP